MLSFFGRILKTKKTAEEVTDPMKKFLIAGLGNIGPKYENTRHNIGFKILDELAAKQEAVFTTQKLGDIAQFRYKGRTFVLLKPSTYMNLSGKAVNYWLQKEKIAVENLLVVTDDLNLPFGTLRLKTKGSDGGHNGLKDIQAQLNTTKYNRFRFGISAEFSKGQQIDYVLGEWSEEELKELPGRLKISAELIESFATAGVSNTMNSFNGK
ncbi:MAG: aminoacyl-tRNA hydrolase [Zunongwangia sp.]|uniref:Peptidyl-tRNA hydrolase n=2 Tax=Zunongwangia profunda TaxID=398743 RepID=D5BES9_ZUNPS|nr:aminoacyl-tRNA hydrolase [Zunongwangia profunda]ADF50808.1 peptidyl-tRNA hydrolase [Zunongwangia profunda SM-A87]MAO34655.1 aminoacyl-tRNA hydrolase [Zunongwangia sp.]MAS69801.1 aminoacyl-tRNA hydrolase [Zunongwangia sp.]HCV82625.1 aminoacyl-tRNA hydrolase [Zunongwangia profunda]|tara:strand:+ start:5850 stop:6479 length:630 start_codon:yes stop_codon:yes gene_type:complete